MCGLAKIILQATVKGKRKGRQKKRWEDNIEELTRMYMYFANTTRAVVDRTVDRYCCRVMCDAPTTLEDYGID